MVLSGTIATVSLIAASYYDLKYRDIPLRLYLVSLIATVSASLLEVYILGAEYHLWEYVWLVNIVLLASIALIVKLGFMGEGDLAYLFLIAMSRPWGLSSECLFPVLFNTIVYYIIALAVFVISIFTYNVVVNFSEIRRLKPPYRYIYPFIAVPLETSKLATRPSWWYPLNLCGKYTLAFNIYENPADVAERVRKELSRGCRQEKVWATYGIPAIPLLTAAYVAALLVGDKPIMSLVSALVGETLPCIALYR